MKSYMPMRMERMQIGVLTYNVPHRKTYDTLCLLRAKGYNDVIVYAIPMHYQKSFKPYIYHRPEIVWQVDPASLCENIGYKYVLINRYEEINDKDSIFLVCGAGILPEEFIKNNVVINSHPGYIPNCRGLDALKWAVYEKQPIGVTSHLIGDEVDAGEVLIREEIPVYTTDSFHAVAQRVYEHEILALVNAIELLSEHTSTQYISGGQFVLHKRMPMEIDRRLFSYFDEYKAIKGIGREH